MIFPYIFHYFPKCFHDFPIFSDLFLWHFDQAEPFFFFSAFREAMLKPVPSSWMMFVGGVLNRRSGDGATATQLEDFYGKIIVI